MKILRKPTRFSATRIKSKRLNPDRFLSKPVANSCKDRLDQSMISVRAYNRIKGKKELAARIRLVFTWRQGPRASKEREKKQNSIRNTEQIRIASYAIRFYDGSRHKSKRVQSAHRSDQKKERKR
jgi:hypothetical protein